MATEYLIASRGNAQLWPSYDPDTFCTSPLIWDRRFPAYLAPFPSEAEAREALLEAGCDPATISAEKRPMRARRGG